MQTTYYHRETGELYTEFYLRNCQGMTDAGIEALYVPVTYDYPEYNEWKEQIVPVENLTITPDGKSAIQNFNVVPFDADGLAASLRRYKDKKLEQLKAAWLEAEDKAILTTSTIGFPVDANERAVDSIEGRIKTMEAAGQTTINFCDASNTFHEISLEQLKTLQIEVLNYRQSLQEAKWSLRETIEQAADFEAVDAVVISFNQTS